ncbi:phage baseplate assembly protein [Acinetobacter bereziniae]|uniref:Phage baseplate assembly protein n=1 Tax=Acinetobacter bereziniae TaxID=106648 RepID=A0A8I1DIK3_ACIBZ|nr:phage baseplate assembly protein [Acinetobacter bereziniae]QQC82991.1 phage baseplate assembly protein [Acinetobacter bereziniae]UUN96139.1 phage baseplate assembly protein [Acinetobacter bereziniae]
MIEAVQSQINKGLNQVRQLFLGIVARSGSKTLQLRGFADETLQEIELYQHVGFNSHIPNDAKVVVVPLQGKTSKSIVIATTGGAVVVNVAEGETCIYDQFGHQVLLTESGIKIKGDTEIEGELKVTKSIEAAQEVSDKKGSMQGMRDTYNPHVHGNSPPPNKPME